MNWDAIGAIGEVLGALGVIITLVYLASQLRQNTRALRSSTYASYVQASFSINDFRAANAGVMVKVDNGQDLTEEENIVFSSFLFKLLGTFEDAYLHHAEGVLSDEIFEARMRGLDTAFFGINTLEERWVAMKDVVFAPSFVRYVDQRRQRNL